MIKRSKKVAYPGAEVTKFVHPVPVPLDRDRTKAVCPHGLFVYNPHVSVQQGKSFSTAEHVDMKTEGGKVSFLTLKHLDLT